MVKLDPKQAKTLDEPDPLAPDNPVCTVCWLDHPKGRCDRDE